MRYAFQPLLIAYIVQWVFCMCNGSFWIFYGIPLLEFISIDFVRKEMYNAVPISLLLFHECTLVMHTCTLNRIWCMDMCIRMECKPFHRPHRFVKKQIGISFYGEQTNERNARKWTLRKKGKSNEIEMETLRWNYIATQECIEFTPSAQNPFAFISHISNEIPAEWSMVQSNRNCLSFDFLFLF